MQTLKLSMGKEASALAASVYTANSHCSLTPSMSSTRGKPPSHVAAGGVDGIAAEGSCSDSVCCGATACAQAVWLQS